MVSLTVGLPTIGLTQMTPQQSSYIAKGLQQAAEANLNADNMGAIDGVREVLPDFDDPQIFQSGIHNVIKRTEGITHAIQSTAQLKNPVQANQLGRITYKAVGYDRDANRPILIPNLSPIEKEFQEGNSTLGIAEQLVMDNLQNIIDFYVNWESDWSINGLCFNPPSAWYPYQEYYFPYVWGEINSDPLRGEYLPNDSLIPGLPSVREVFEDALKNDDVTVGGIDVTLPRGPYNLLPPFSLADQIFDDAPGKTDNAYTFAEEMAPLEINRVKAIAEPDFGSAPENYTLQKEVTDRFGDHLDSLGEKGSIPNTPRAIEPGRPALMKRLQNKFGDRMLNTGGYGSAGRNLEHHRFSGISGMGASPQALLGNCHYATVTEVIPPIVHRSDNPAVIPFSRSSHYSDLLLLMNGRLDKLSIADTSGSCMGYDLFSGAPGGLPQTLGFDGGEFGLLGKLNPGNAGVGGIAANANRNNCLKEGGSIYPLTNRIQGNKNFKANFFTKFLRSDKLTSLYSFGLMPSFHRWNYNRGGRTHPATKLQVVRSSFGEQSPSPLTENRYEQLWSSNPTNYDRAEKGTERHRAVYVEWHYINCCPGGYHVVWGPEPQIRGRENFNKDMWTF